MFFILQEAQNRPAGASVPVLSSEEHIALLYSPKAGTLAPADLFWASCQVKNI
jgi:hypothetical protein